MVFVIPLLAGFLAILFAYGAMISTVPVFAQSSEQQDGNDTTPDNNATGSDDNSGGAGGNTSSRDSRGHNHGVDSVPDRERSQDGCFEYNAQ